VSSPGPRIALTPPRGNPDEVQSLLDVLSRRGRPPLNLFLALARHPDLLRDYLPFGSRLLLTGTLPARDRELAILRTAWLCGCEYEWGQHLRIAARAGVTEEEIADIGDPAAARWTAHEAALLRAAQELLDDHDIGQDTWDTLAQGYGDAGLVEFAMLVGHYGMLAGLLNAARVPRDEGVPGFPGGRP
jgi:4-carboxymuconolactone decarboxylase